MGGLAWGTRVEACGGGEAKGHRLRPLIAPQGSGAGTAGDFFPPRASPNSQPKWEVFRRPFLRPRFLSGIRAGPALFRPHLCGAEAVAVVTVTVTVALAVAMAAGARGPSSRGYAQPVCGRAWGRACVSLAARTRRRTHRTAGCHPALRKRARKAKQAKKRKEMKGK